MLVIRFQRVGRKNDPAFRIVVTERRSKPKSGELEILGSFHPKTREVRFKTERILYWLSKGAKASPRVHNLLVAKGVIRGSKIDVSKRVVQPAASALSADEAQEGPVSAAPEPAGGPAGKKEVEASAVDGGSESS